jgi:alpha-glucosidase
MWVLGFQQARYSYYPRARVEEVAARFRADRIPADVLWFDIDFQEKNRPSTVDPITFPDFPGLIHQLTAEHFHTVVITDLHIADLPNQGYAPYGSGKAGDHFVKENGQDYIGKVWPGASGFPNWHRARIASHTKFNSWEPAYPMSGAGNVTKLLIVHESSGKSDVVQYRVVTRQ